ncbi:MAG: hypothetical protein LBI60_03225 [Bacteroidales bacterium]|nr:hypothetical protein [Bacteroidales bacterium]
MNIFFKPSRTGYLIINKPNTLTGSLSQAYLFRAIAAKQPLQKYLNMAAKEKNKVPMIKKRYDNEHFIPLQTKKTHRRNGNNRIASTKKINSV